MCVCLNASLTISDNTAVFVVAANDEPKINSRLNYSPIEVAIGECGLKTNENKNLNRLLPTNWKFTKLQFYTASSGEKLGSFTRNRLSNRNFIKQTFLLKIRLLKIHRFNFGFILSGPDGRVCLLFFKEE